jgi:hypothetical protein
VKQIGLSFRMWAQDNGGRFPMHVSTNAGGTMELVGAGTVFPHFKVLSNELGTPKIVICPMDSRTSATNFALSDTNVSYFIAPDADESLPGLWLTGDRNLTVGGAVLKPGLFTMHTNGVMGWGAQLHSDRKVMRGNLCFVDSSVQQFTNASLRQAATNALSAWFAVTNAPFRLIIP